MRNLIDINTLDNNIPRKLLETAKYYKSKGRGLVEGAPLLGRTLAMIFEKPSTRTRISFEVAMTELGGSAIYLDAKTMQMGRGETIEDTAKVLGRYLDGIMIRATKHETLLLMAAHSNVPVIIGLTNLSHPCQTFADIMTFGFGAPYFDSLLVESNGNLSNVANNPQNYDSLQQDTSVSIIAGNSSNPKSIPEIFEGTNLKVSWIREFNFGYGVGLIRKEKFGLYVGIGVKYLQGMALLDVSSDGNNLNGFMSYSPSFSNPNNVGLFSVGNAIFKIPKAAGRGFGVDLGVNVKLFKRIKIGLAVNDIGSITWSKNTYNVTTSSSLTNFRVAGFYKDSNSISASTGGVTFDSILNSLVDIQQGSFERKVNLPTTMRLGFGIQFGKILEIGGEVIAPLNSNPGNFSSALYSFGGDVKLGFIVLSAGTVFQQNRQTRIPVGILFAPINRTWELGVSTRDIQSLIKRHDVDNPMYSTAFGFLRFRL